MNIKYKVSECLSPCKVISKYFSKESLMDDSSSDFKEKKKHNTGPKQAQKRKASKLKRTLKQLKGQKDIRSIVKDKKSELVSYSKNFDQVCKNSDLDIDSEQLQLAIALSKSLHDAETKSDDNLQDTKPLTSQERKAKIRLTLQEYGFRVNTIRNDTTKKRKFKKQYKLLLVSDDEKKQNISDKYAEVLVTNIHKSPVKNNNIFNSINNNDQELYYKASHILYESMKYDDVFYVKDLFEKSLHKPYLLRDWANIPGRPVSPKKEQSDFNIDNIQCTQEELDYILSGSIYAAQSIIKNKHLVNNRNNIVGNYKEITPVKAVHEDKMSTICNNETHGLNSNSEVGFNTEDDLKNFPIIKLSASQQARCVSPDIFDDEVSIISDTNNPNQISQQNVNKNDNNVIDYMDLTECVSDALNNDAFKSKFSVREINVSKRKSNDFMEITECVPTSSEPYIIENIDLTQNFSESKKKNVSEINVELDLTQSSNSEDGLPEIKISRPRKENSLDETIVINEFVEVIPNSATSKETENIQIIGESLCYDDLHRSKEKVELDKSNENIINRSSNSDTEDKYNNSNFSSKENSKRYFEMDFVEFSNFDNDLQVQEISDKRNNSIDKNIINIDLEFNLNPVTYEDTLTSQKVLQFSNDQCLNKSKENTKVDIGNSSTEFENNSLHISKKSDVNNSNTEINYEVDLTQSSNSDEELPLVEKGDTKKESFLEQTVLITKDIDSNINADKEILENDSEFTCDDINKTEAKNKSVNDKHDNNYSVSYNYSISYKREREREYNYNEQVYNNSHFNDYCDENNSSKNTLQTENNISNKSYLNYHEQPNNNSYANDNYRNSFDNSNRNIEVYVHEPDSIDLTQNLAVEAVENVHKQKTYDVNSLSERDNISIDYDEMFNDVVNSASGHNSKASLKSANITSNSISPEVKCDKSNNEVASNPSQTSDCFEISDTELNYSLSKSTHNFDVGGISVLNNISASKMQTTKRSNCYSGSLNRSLSESDLPSVTVKDNNPCTSKALVKSTNFITETSPVINKCLIDEIQQTPRNNEYIIKTKDVTPMLDYESMTSPERNRELNKYGLKPFKRKRAIQLLKYLYNQTHPIVESCEVEESSPSKKRKLNRESKSEKSKSPRKLEFSNLSEPNKENTLYNETKQTPDIREISCLPEDWVFQKREKAKVHSCKVPLHIVFHNYVSCRQLLREAILRYEPVNIDVIHKDLVACGYKYNPKDLLRFMDKKCITVKTMDNNSRNRKS